MNTIEKICDNRKKYFGNMFKGLLSECKKELAPVIGNKKYEEIIEDRDALEYGILFDLYIEINKHVMPFLILKLHEYAENKDGDRIRLYEEFVSKHESYLDNLLKSKPVLKKTVNRSIERRIRYIKEILDNCKEEFPLIKMMIGGDAGIMGISMSDGDSHNGGKKVVIIEFRDKKLVYKPRSMDQDDFFYECVKTINMSPQTKYLNYLPRFISREGYSIQEFLKNVKGDEEINKEAYYYRAGALLSVCYALDCSDIHYENLMAIRDYPIIIDLENLIHLDRKLPDIGSVTSIVKEYNGSVLGTMMLPTNFIFSVFDFDIGGLTGKNDKSEKWKRFSLVDEGTADMRFEKGTFRMDSTTNQATSEQDDIKKYAQALVDGFEQGYLCIMNNKDSLWKSFMSKNIFIRQVLRPTAVYARMLSTLEYPEYYESEERIKAFLNKLNTDDEKEKIEAEIKSMEEGDIPFFCSDSKTSALYDGEHNLLCADYFVTNAADKIVASMNKMTKKDMEKQKYYILLSLSTLKGEVKRPIKCDEVSSVPQTVAGEIEEKVFWDGEDKCNILTLLNEGKKSLVSVCNADIYEYGGMILFMYAAGIETKNNEHIRTADALLREVEATKAWNGNKPGSAFCGSLSLAYIYAVKYALLNKRADYERCIELIENTEYEKSDEFDFISGLSSGLVFVCNFYNKYSDVRVLPFIKSAGKKLIGTVSEADNLLVGLAHGAAGPISAFALLYGITKEAVYKDMCEKLIEFENEHFDNNLNNWKDIRGYAENDDLPFWCFGAAGMAVSRTIAFKNICSELTKRDFNRAIRRIKKTDLNDNHGLCHGIVGKQDVEKWLSKVTGDETVINREELLHVKNTIEKDGISLGNPENLVDYSFMNGLSGIGYAVMRQNNEKLPCILALEV